MSLYAALGKGAELGVAAVSKQLHEGVTKRRLGCWTLLEFGPRFLRPICHQQVPPSADALVASMQIKAACGRLDGSQRTTMGRARTTGASRGLPALALLTVM